MGAASRSRSPSRSLSLLACIAVAALAVAAPACKDQGKESAKKAAGDVDQLATPVDKDVAEIEAGPDGKVIVSIFRGQPRKLPFAVEMMERHPLGSQAFVPLSGKPYLVVVAPAGDPPGVDALRVFMARGDQGVNYAPGVWHHPLLALDAVCDFVVVDRSGTAPNCDEVRVDPPGLIGL